MNATATRGRLRRILAIALVFVATALAHIYSSSRSHATFIQSILDVVPSFASRYGAADSAGLIIFYNLYIPPEGEAGIANAINVIEDQIGQIADEMKKLNATKSGVVFYNLIGNEEAFTQEQMSNLCRRSHPNLDCQMLQYYSEAGEAVTLQDVHDFCHADRAMHDDSLRVVYLHSKGSYHSQKENHIWRRIMTSASLHPQCLRPPDDSCDVCGAQFYIKYAIMFPGNMWTAKCSYIRKLVPPNDGGRYERLKRESIKKFLFLRMWGVLDATLDTDNVEHFGLGRYAWEHWIASRPSIKPCEIHTTDVGPMILLGKEQGREFGPEHYKFGMAPQRIDHNLGGRRQARLRLEANPDRQFKEYYYLPGNLLKWFTLYGSDGVPDENSWVWRDFPAGQRWKELVGLHKERAVDVMIQDSNPRFYSIYPDAEVLRGVDVTIDDQRETTTVFYQIYVASNGRDQAMKAVEAQFEVLGRGQYQKIRLFVSVSGASPQEAETISSLCSGQPSIECRHVKGQGDKMHGMALSILQRFCGSNPASNVVYLSNFLPGFSQNNVDKIYDTRQIQTTTASVLSESCRPSNRCNVCGTHFYPLPFLGFSGNMFSASCSYVDKLLPLDQFEKEMNSIAGDALVGKVTEEYTDVLFGFNPRMLGSYQHSIEHWIGSHPDLRPCDVAPLTETNVPYQEADKSLSAGEAPRRGSANPTSIDQEKEEKFRRNREAALREYYYLAGNTLRWQRLYEKVPDDSSWVWNYFPDGQLWRAAVRTSGLDAVNELSKHVSPMISQT